MVNLIPVLLSGGSNFVADTCNNIADFVKAVGSYIVLIVGIAAILAAVVQLVKAFISNGRVNWVVIISCLLIGGLLTFGGWKILKDENLWGGIGKNTLEEINQGNEPEAIGDVSDGSSGGTSVELAKHGMYILASKFIIPFGKAVAVSAGALLVAIAAFLAAKHFIAGGRAQTNWKKIAIMCVLGSVLFTATPTNNDGGWEWLRDKMVGGTKDGVINAVDGNSSNQSDGLTPAGFSGGSADNNTPG